MLACKEAFLQNEFNLFRTVEKMFVGVPLLSDAIEQQHVTTFIHVGVAVSTRPLSTIYTTALYLQNTDIMYT